MFALFLLLIFKLLLISTGVFDVAGSVSPNSLWGKKWQGDELIHWIDG